MRGIKGRNKIQTKVGLTPQPPEINHHLDLLTLEGAQGESSMVIEG